MKRMLVATTLVVLGLGSLTSPAHAASLPASCDADGGVHGVDALVSYTAPNPTQHYWTGTRFELVGPGGSGGKSNMTIRVWENRSLKAQRSSLDNLAKHYVYKSSEHPRFQLNVRTQRAQSEYVDFVGVFDTAGPDPACTAKTATI